MFSPSLESQLQQIDRLTHRSQIYKFKLKCDRQPFTVNGAVTAATAAIYMSACVQKSMFDQHVYSEFNGCKRHYERLWHTCQKNQRRSSSLSGWPLHPVSSSCNWTHHRWRLTRNKECALNDSAIKPQREAESGYRCMSLCTSLLISSSSIWLPQSPCLAQRDTGPALSGVVKLGRKHKG